MSDWTLGAVKARNMEINALCENEACGHLVNFNLNALIEGVGADYKLGDIPPIECPACGVGPLTIRLSFVDPPRERRTDRRDRPSQFGES
jgi:hypothetical protein